MLKSSSVTNPLWSSRRISLMSANSFRNVFLFLGILKFPSPVRPMFSMERVTGRLHHLESSAPCYGTSGQWKQSRLGVWKLVCGWLGWYAWGNMCPWWSTGPILFSCFVSLFKELVLTHLVNDLCPWIARTWAGGNRHWEEKLGPRSYILPWSQIPIPVPRIFVWWMGKNVNAIVFSRLPLTVLI